MATVTEVRKTYDGLYGICRKQGYCVADCGLCKYIPSIQQPAYKATNQAARYKRKKQAGVLLGPDTPGRQIGYKEPLRLVEDGYGYYGTITVDDETQTMVQCHICGFYFKLLGQHLTEHHMNQNEYKRKYGLTVAMPLMTGDTLQKWKEKRPYNYTPEHRRHLDRARVLAAEANKVSPLVGRDTLPLEYYNRFGICPDQVIDKYLHLKEKLGHPPSLHEMQREYNTSVPRLLMKALGLPGWTGVTEAVEKLEHEALRSKEITESQHAELKSRSNFKPKPESRTERFHRQLAGTRGQTSQAA